LLAADLYAWLLSKRYNDGIADQEAEALKIIQRRGHVGVELTKKLIAEMREKLPLGSRSEAFYGY